MGNSPFAFHTGIEVTYLLQDHTMVVKPGIPELLYFSSVHWHECLVGFPANDQAREIFENQKCREVQNDGESC